MLTGLKNAFRIKDLRDKILFTIAMLIVYRIGAHVPVPGVPFQGMAGLLPTDGAMGLLTLFSGGALSYVSVFSLGIMPYITSSIIMQLLQSVIPSLHELAREGEVGQTKITQYSRYLTLGLSILNSIGYLFLFKSYGISFAEAGAPEVIFDIMVVGTLTAGSMLIMWIGELITQRGIGNGMSLIIFANIMAGLPQSIFSSLGEGTMGIVVTVVIFVVILCVIPFIVFLERGQRRIPVQYAKRVVGRKMYGGQSTHLPIKVNMSGVMPIIFASSILTIPSTIQLFVTPTGFWKTVLDALSTTGWVYALIYFLLILMFAYFYVAIQYNPIEMANNLRQNNGTIPGIRPGKPTSDYIQKILSKITLIGALFLAVIALLPIAFSAFTGMHNLMMGGTSVIILVGVALDTMKQMESQMMMRHYKGFLD